jgi:hypothetical protein
MTSSELEGVVDLVAIPNPLPASRVTKPWTALGAQWVSASVRVDGLDTSVDGHYPSPIAVAVDARASVIGSASQGTS